MMQQRLLFFFGLGAALCACSNQVTKPAASPVAGVHQTQNAAAPLPAETNPPGDIPDTQAFVIYTSPDRRFSVAYPEGWERSEQSDGVTFVHDFDGERVRKNAGPGRPPAVRDLRSIGVWLRGRAATLLAFTSNSLPNAVTGRRVRLQNNTYIFKTSRGTLALDLWAPLGADNVDQWQRIASSFKTR